MSDQDAWVVLLVVGLLAAAWYFRKRWRASGSAYGTAAWATKYDLRRAKMLGDEGLILGRCLDGKQELIRISDYTHLLTVAPTGAGKGVSLVLPNLLTYNRGSCFIWDPKGENYKITANARAQGQEVILLDPFGVTGEQGFGFNPLDLIEDGPRLVDETRALAEAIVGGVKTGAETDSHWLDSATSVVHGMAIYVLLRFAGEERNLNSVCELVADPELFSKAVAGLREMGGIPGRIGSYLSGLEGKERSSVLSTTNRALACFSSQLIAAMLARSDFDVTGLLRRKPGMSVYFVLPQDQLQAQRGTLRLVVSSLIQLVMRRGMEKGGECLFMLDECAALGQLDDLEQALVLGRGAGVRLFTFWQSADQARVAFKDKPGLFFDNCSTQIYFGAASFETAERISKMLGDETITISTYTENDGRSRQHGGCEPNHGTQVSENWGTNKSEIGRALLRPEEILTLPGDLLIAFLRGVPPVAARRIKWFEDDFARYKPVPMPLWRVLLAVMAALLIAAACLFAFK